MAFGVSIEFNSKIGNFSHIPGSMSSEEYLDFLIVLDIILKLSSDKIGRNNELISLISPLNVSIWETKNDETVIGVSQDKAIMGNTVLTRLEGKALNIESAVESINEVTWKTLGFRTKYYTFFDNELLKNYTDLFELLRNEKNPGKRFELIVDNQPNLIFLMAAAADKLVDNILKEEKKNMEFNPIFKARGLTIDDKMIFCALPFTSERLEIFDEVLKPQIETEFGMQLIRSGNIFMPNLNIPESIWTYINQAKIVIVDLSDKNPNVFYELGICHTLGKQVITICDEDSLKTDYDARLPFDVGSINTIFYKNKGNGMNELIQKLKYNIQSVIDGKPYIAN
ncbi:hypothetical protein ABZZ53_000489 [Listeria monocytogenes]